MITVHCIPQCEPCEALCAALSRAGVLFSKRMCDPDAPENADKQFPIVYMDHIRLRPMTTSEYIAVITGGSD